MPALALCRNRLTTTLLTSAIQKAGLSGHAHSEEINFWSQLRIEKPRFVILTNEHLDKSALISTLRSYNPNTHVVLCVLPNTLPPEQLWPLPSAADVDSICTIYELTDCLRSLINGSFFASSFLLTYSLYSTKESLPGWHDLMEGERRILQKLAQGQTDTQIADALCISPKTVNNHKAKIAIKLNVYGGPGSLIKFVLLNREQLLASLG